MAKAKIRVEHNFTGLVKDLTDMTDSFSWEVKRAAEKQMVVFSDAIRMNWASMIPWSSSGDFVSDSIGYNVAYGKGGDIVGMAGVFKLDAVEAKHGKTQRDMSAPQLAYWAEFGYTPRGASHITGTPFMSSAYYATLSKQDEIFANELAKNLGVRLGK